MQHAGATDFDFLLGSWHIHNRRRTNALYPEKQGIWQEFPAAHTGAKYLDGSVIIDHFEGTFPDGEIRKGMTIRAYNAETRQWSLVWLDNRQPPDFRPLLGAFEDGIGRFSQIIETPDGQPLHVRFTWDNITAHTARWQQAFSFDGGKTWDTNWIMDFTKNHQPAWSGGTTMSETPVTQTIPNLSSLGNVVPEGYQYYQKLVTPGEDLSLPNAYLKWYTIRRPDGEITPEQLAESRAHIAAETQRLNINGELGFVLLHHCGSVLLLLLQTWRETNEIWESTYMKDLTQPGGYQPITYPTSHRGAFCVWELGPVWHERNAWVRFLSSNRDDHAKLAYINDRFTGLI